VRRILEVVENCALYAVGTPIDALCAEVLEVIHCKLPSLLEVLEVPKVMHCVLLCLLEALDVPELMRCVLLCLLEVLRRWTCRR